MIEIRNLSKSYDGINKIVDNISITIPTGSVFGFLGSNGAGKTTTIKMLVGLNRPDKGSVFVDGNSPLQLETREEIGFMPEEPHFYDQLTGLEFLEFASKLFKRSRPGSKSNLEELLQKTGIYNARNNKIETYSKGMRQRLGFAQALVNEPKYIFLDEPLEGLDPIGRRETKIIIEDLKKQDRTVFFNSHILSDVENLCDQIGIIHQGRMIYSGSVDGFRNNKTLEEQFVETIQEKQ